VVRVTDAVATISASLKPLFSACLDRRPFSSSGYMHYVDGRGWQSGGSRRAGYCPHCHDNEYTPTSSWAAVAAPPSQLQQSNLYDPTWAQLHSARPHETDGETSRPASSSSTTSLSASTLSPFPRACTICFDAVPDVLLLPCAHLVSCATCTVRLFLTPDKDSRTVSNWEINGYDIINRTSSFASTAGELGFDALRGLHSSSADECPVCRTEVRRWIRVYT
jgi:hypothetical protein